MKNLLLTFLFFFTSLTFLAQEKSITDNFQDDKNTASFYVRIPNSNNAPQILSKSTSNIVLKHKNLKIQNVFNKYKIHDFIRAFPTAKTRSLNEVYFIKCNSLQLMHTLRNNFPDVYTFSEEIEGESKVLTDIEVSSTLFTPNDYGLAVTQTNLDLINAKQAWDYTTGNPNIKLGITDTEFNISHEELVGTISVTGTNSSNLHGTGVAQNMAGNTNNGKGLASIGHNCFIEARTGLSLNNALLLSQAGVKVINGSWGSAFSYSECGQNVVNEIYDNGTTLVFAAGNTSNNTKNFYPAAYDNVISVTSIHHKNFMQPAYDDNGVFIGNVLRKIDTHDNSWVYLQRADGSHNHTYAVDLAAPGYEVPTTNSGGGYYTTSGTSHAAPKVAGTIGLMLSVNDAIMTDEIESILKLTSADIYNIPENNNYIDKLGAGRLDAGKAVEMAYNMAQPYGIVEVKDRDFYRDWSFELKNAPYQIKTQNQIFRDTIKVDFIARNNIEIENTLIEPNSLGYTVLSIDPTIPLPSTPSASFTITKSNVQSNTTFFDGATFILDHFLINGNREDLDLSTPDEQGFFNPPSISFELNEVTNQLEALGESVTGIGGLCNATLAIYEDKGNYLKVISRGATTLIDCDNSLQQEYRFFNIITGNYYEQNPAKEVYYEVTDDQNGLWAWVDSNEKLFFTKGTLDISEFDLSKLIQIFPNPTSDYLHIKSAGTVISKISIFDLQGKEILIKTNNLERINVSHLSKGIYFIKLITPLTSITKKIILQ